MPVIFTTQDKLTCMQSKRFAGDFLSKIENKKDSVEAFFILDADDWLMPRYLERVASYMEAKPDVAAVGCDYQVIHASGIVQPSSINATPITEIAVRNPLPSCSLVRLSTYLEVGGYQTEYQYEDWALWASFVKAGHRIFRWPQVLYNHLRHETNLTNGQDQMVGKRQILKLLGIPDSSIATLLPPASSGNPMENTAS